MVTSMQPDNSGRTPRQLIGIIEGEGVGSEVIGAATDVLHALQASKVVECETRKSGPIGNQALAEYGTPLPDHVVDFCRSVFAEGGCVLCGPGGGRFVYDLRRRFDLYCKICPIRVDTELASAGPFHSEHVRNVDLVIVRDNISGLYQGHSESRDEGEDRVAEHRMVYTQRQVERIVKAGARIAQSRAGKMCVVIKDGGLEQLSRLWRDVALGVSARFGVECEFINVDHMAYRLLRFPHDQRRGGHAQPVRRYSVRRGRPVVGFARSDVFR